MDLQKAENRWMEHLVSIKQALRRLGPAKLATLAVSALAVLLLLAWVAARPGEPMGLLYSGLDPGEAGRIGQRLDELKVAYEAKGDGTVILVAMSQVARVRMELAASGLPHQAGAGYELLDTQSPMSMTSFMQRVQRLRALEGELARTIVTLNGVRSARVHLVMPERESFAREGPKPTGSVAVVMAGAMRLNPSQAAAIRLLVAGAVPQLQQEDVSVLDPSGIVLAAGGSDVMPGGRMSELKASRELSLQHAVTELLEPLVGRGKVRVTASVDIDNSREVSREEKYDPLSQVERSKQTQQDQETSDENRPHDAVSVGQNLPNPQTATQTAAQGKTSSSNTRNSQTVNYELSSSKNERVREPGDVRRLTVAVVVDGLIDDKGAFRPRPKEELDRFAELVRTAVGFDAKRGDQIAVDTMRFVADETLGTGAGENPEAASLPWTWIAVAGVLAALLLLGGAFVLRKRGRLALARNGQGTPLLAASQPALGSSPGAALPGAASASDQTALVPRPSARGLPAPVLALYDLVDARPEEALAVIRTWIADSEAAA